MQVRYQLRQRPIRVLNDNRNKEHIANYLSQEAAGGIEPPYGALQAPA